MTIKNYMTDSRLKLTQNINIFICQTVNYVRITDFI